ARPKVNAAQRLKEGDAIPFQPWARQTFEERQANNSKDDPSARCLPTGPTQKPTLATIQDCSDTRIDPDTERIANHVSANLYGWAPASKAHRLARVAGILHREVGRRQIGRRNSRHDRHVLVASGGAPGNRKLSAASAAPA